MITEILNIPNGAQFCKADLHIHSFGVEGSYDVEDTNMTPENIIDTAISKGLKIISITDHNEIGNVKIALAYAKDKDILIIPGIEISTTQGHLLVYFETYTQLKNFSGKLNISEKRDRCTQSIVDCLNFAKEYRGIGILAHIELTSGFEKTINRFGPQIEDVITHPLVYGLEIGNKDSIDFYTKRDESSDRVRLLNLRIDKLNHQDNFEFAKLMSSDAHTLDKLGQNIDGNNKLTRIKVDNLSFQSFKIALLNHQSRIRLENFIPEKVPHFIGLKLEGGLLDNQIIHFNNNLNCIIGGRGAGKSTLFESIRECSGNSVNSKLVDCEVWPEKISLIYEDETGQQMLFSREKNSEIINQTDTVTGITKINIENYGQGEMQQNADNPIQLNTFLDKFINIQQLKTEDTETINLLRENQSECNKLRLEVVNIAETEKERKNTAQKLENLKQENVGDLVTYQSALIKEREFRDNLIKDLRELVKGYRNLLSDKSIFNDVLRLTDENIIVGKDNFKNVKSIIIDLSSKIDDTSTNLQETLNEKIEELKIQLTEWKSKEKSIQDKIDKKRDELKEKGIPFDIGKIHQISKDLIYYDNRLKRLKKQKEHLIEKNEERKELINKRKEIKNKIYYTRLTFANTINENLKNTIDDFQVSIKYNQGGYSPEFETIIKTTMDYRTSSVPKTKLIANSINPIDFSENIQKKKADVLKNLKDKKSSPIFSDDEVSKVLTRFNENRLFEELESIEFDDLPSIIVTKVYKNESNEDVIVTKSLAQLSLGQQQSILLAILLHSKSKTPLIIDQPEDNLDSEFIYKTIVKNLRNIKEQRQVIIVTHNANIAVLGDAEQIIPLKSTNNKSFIIDRGAIDNSKTIDLCCAILEGGKQAFERRKEIYGL